MNNEEAIIALKGLQEIATQNRPLLVEALEMAIKAIEKQIPMKPKIVDDMDCCPVCGREDGGCTESWHRPYCCNCGQALDWSDYDY